LSQNIDVIANVTIAIIAILHVYSKHQGLIGLLIIFCVYSKPLPGSKRKLLDHTCFLLP